jgi:hypothetical protein
MCILVAGIHALAGRERLLVFKVPGSNESTVENKHHALCGTLS